jgi:phosphatidylinositol alpha 1,6-mannosyltransferase
MEALASGTPLVATPAGGIASVVEDGRTGLLVPERDSDALADAVGSLLADADRRVLIGLAARHDVNERYTWERVASRFVQIYDHVTFPSVAQPGSGSHP